MERLARSPRYRPWWLLAVLPLLPALGVGFLLDDWIGLARLSDSGWSAVAAQLWPAGGEFLRPLGWALFQIELTLFGLRGFPFHAVHLGLFVLGAWLTGRLAARFGGNEHLAAIAAALALLYPGRVETYGWLAAVFDLLALDLGLTLLILHQRWRGRAPRLDRATMLAGLAFASTLAKESAYALLPLLLLWELLPGLLRPAPGRSRLVMGAAASGGFGAGILYRLWALQGVGGYAGTGLADVLEQLWALPETVFRAAFVPVNPHFGGASTALGFACAAALAIALAGAGLRARHHVDARRLLAAGSSLALLGLLPTLPYLSPSAPWTAGRYLTFFGAGVAIAVAGAAAGSLDRRRLGYALIATLAVAWTAASVLNLLPWHEAARGRDRILAVVGEDTRGPGPHQVWVRGPINRIKGVHLLGGGLQAAIEVTYPERDIQADSAFFQAFRGRPVGPPPAQPGVEVHLYRFDPAAGRVERLPRMEP